MTIIIIVHLPNKSEKLDVFERALKIEIRYFFGLIFGYYITKVLDELNNNNYGYMLFTFIIYNLIEKNTY